MTAMVMWFTFVTAMIVGGRRDDIVHVRDRNDDVVRSCDALQR